MAWDPIDSNELNPGFPVLKHMRKAWNSLLWLYGQLGTLASGEIQNGSFEINSDGNSIPDNWTWSAYPGGSCALDTTTPAHGATAVKITHPGGAGNGGGVLTSDYTETSGLSDLVVSWIHWSSAATIKTIVNVRFYTAAKVYINSTTLYTSTNNPTTPAKVIGICTPPSTARYFKIELIGGYTDTNVAGSVYFDNIGTSPGFNEIIKTATTTSTTMAEVSRGSGIADAGSFYVTVPRCGNIPLSLTVSFSARSIYDNAQVRIRIGSMYSELFPVVGGYITFTFTMSLPSGLSGTAQVFAQLENSSAQKTTTSDTAAWPLTNFQ